MLTAACQTSSRTASVGSRFLMRAIASFHDLDLKAAGFADPNLVQLHLSATRHLFSLLNGLSVQGEQARIISRSSLHVKKGPQACSQPILSYRGPICMGSPTCQLSKKGFPVKRPLAFLFLLRLIRSTSSSIPALMMRTAAAKVLFMRPHFLSFDQVYPSINPLTLRFIYDSEGI